MIEIPTLSLVVLALVFFACGVLAGGQILLYLARHHAIRTICEPGCDKCKREASFFVKANAECPDCMFRRHDEEDRKDEAEHEERMREIDEEYKARKLEIEAEHPRDE